MDLRFENDVKTYGTQAFKDDFSAKKGFENDVKTYGTQAYFEEWQLTHMFENDVKTYGTQAFSKCKEIKGCLRMM